MPEQVEVRACFVVPALFRLVADNLVDVVGRADAHDVHQALLEHVAEHLRVEASGLVALGPGGVKADLFRSAVADGHFGQ